jgi:multidrug efflux pump subunit AcrA (membrane-fusion protein)
LGQSAVVSLPGPVPTTFTATVSEIGAQSENSTGTFRVVLALPPQPGLRSGLIGSARLDLGNRQAKEGAVAIPVAAVFGARADEGFVYVFDRKFGRIHRRLIAIGQLTDGSLTVLKGLAPREEVVISKMDQLRDGMVVKRTTS